MKEHKENPEEKKHAPKPKMKEPIEKKEKETKTVGFKSDNWDD
jgi:hypothetical protein